MFDPGRSAGETISLFVRARSGDANCTEIRQQIPSTARLIAKTTANCIETGHVALLSVESCWSNRLITTETS